MLKALQIGGGPTGMRAAIVSTYPPRACGIGTFAADVRASLIGLDEVESVAKVVIVDDPSRPQRPGVVAAISQGTRGDYVRAARILGRRDIDVVLLEHEYGIFGGRDGEYILSLAEELTQPLVVTLHTVLSQPSPRQARVLETLCGHAELVIVMTETALRLLVENGTCAEAKIRVVPHGAPTLLVERAAAGAAPHGRDERLRGRFVLSTFGLLSSGKGVENVLKALPAIIEQHPETLYVIAGRTHPGVAQREGERYRLSLQQLVIELGLQEHVEFDDRFLAVDEIADLLAVTSVFVTPYLDPEQTSSGALTFAIAAGCAVVSTPYRYAEDMLASGAGELVPFADPTALGAAVCRFIDKPELLSAARGEARRIGESVSWPSVAGATAVVLRDAMELMPRRDAILSLEPQPASFRHDHLLTMVDDAGIVQHAHGAIPNRRSGYCVDDVARLAVVALELGRRSDEQLWSPVVYRSLAFLHDATDEQPGMRNFMAYDRRWLDEPHVGDHVGRAIWALGEILSTAWASALVEPTQRLLDSLVGGLGGPTSLRTDAYTVLGLARLDPDRLDDPARTLLECGVERLATAFEATASEGWLWFEHALAYDNARLPQALIAGGAALGREDQVASGLESLRWLGDESGLATGMLRLTGHRGRKRSEPALGSGDEQPLEASAFVEAELAAFAVTGEREHGVRARLAFDWFLGRNHLSRPLYDFATGGCSDGLGDEDVNHNEGAESTLAFHRAALLLDASDLSSVPSKQLAAAAA
ncbi:MAG TPA: glycosyltransferase family 4 protein [Gaiellaceae bacterium]|jgi:glycosyltransferase involved in cell wall biosynthesis|nr:glycosyltransferase family 4 protein [Gaiellaceae bacterium]